MEQTIRKFIFLLGIMFLSLLSSAQDFGYVTYTKYQSDSTEKDCNIVFMFNINEKGDVISVDDKLTPVYLKSVSDYSNNNGTINFYVEDNDKTKYYVTLTNNYLLLESNKSKVKFTK